MTSAPAELLLLLHPTEPLVLAGADPADPLQVPADRSWPLGPDLTAGERVLVRVAVARDAEPVPGTRWVDRPPAGWPEPLATVAAERLAEDTGRAPVPALRPAWMRRGWWQRAATWCDDVLAAGCAGPGVTRSADLEPVQHWATSAVARVPTTAGPCRLKGLCWLKAVPPYFAREPAVLDLLGALVPGRVPRLLAGARQPDGSALLLLADAGLVQPDEVDDAERTGLAALLGRLQADTLPALDRLAAAGTADRSPAALAAELRRILDDGVTPGLLSVPERAALRAAVPAVTADLDRFAELAGRVLPAVLGHGDLHVWNVLRSPDGPGRVLIDWTDASVGPPGLDLVALHDREAGQAARSAARDSYVQALAAGTGVPAADLDRAVRAAGAAAQVVQVSAYEEILAHTEPAGREYFARWAGHWLRRLAGPGELIPPSS